MTPHTISQLKRCHKCIHDRSTSLHRILLMGGAKAQKAWNENTRWWSADCHDYLAPSPSYSRHWDPLLPNGNSSGRRTGTEKRLGLAKLPISLSHRDHLQQDFFAWKNHARVITKWFKKKTHEFSFWTHFCMFPSKKEPNHPAIPPLARGGGTITPTPTPTPHSLVPTV